MKKILFLSFALFFIPAILQTNVAFSFSIEKPVNSSGLMKFVQGSEFIKLSFRQFAAFTGQKENVWNRISFNVLKNKIKRDLKKDPNLSITKYYSKTGRAISTLGWILYGLLLLLLILLLAMGIALKK